jgi:hypothetical protein
VRIDHDFHPPKYKRHAQKAVARAPQKSNTGGVDMLKVLADLRLYKGQLDEAITALDGLARQRGEKRGAHKPRRRRGRPTGALANTPAPVAVKRRKRKPPQAASHATS